MNNLNLNITQIPLFTNKRNTLSNNKYTFTVNPSFTKVEIKRFITSFYGINVIKINTSIIPKTKQKNNKFVGIKPQYKKVTVTLIKDNTTNNLFIKNKIIKDGY